MAHFSAEHEDRSLTGHERNVPGTARGAAHRRSSAAELSALAGLDGLDRPLLTVLVEVERPAPGFGPLSPVTDLRRVARSSITQCERPWRQHGDIARAQIEVLLGETVECSFEIPLIDARPHSLRVLRVE